MAEQADLEAPAAVAAPEIAPKAPKEAIEEKEVKAVSEAAEVATDSVAPKEDPVAPGMLCFLVLTIYFQLFSVSLLTAFSLEGRSEGRHKWRQNSS